LGLATVYAIVERGGGRIDVESEPGKGTVFRVFFPRVDAMAVAPEQPARPVAPSVETRTILVVDDDEVVRVPLEHVLRTHGYRVFAAADPKAALDLIERETPALDLVITDMVMPNMSGRELADALAEGYDDLPVLYISGYSRERPDESHPIALDAFFLSKPFATAELLERVAVILSEYPETQRPE
jgi:CheY-like chemotaxis protein